MTLRVLFFLFIAFSFFTSRAQSFADIALPATTGDSVRISDYQDAKAVVLIFSGVHCVYSKKYNDRILATIAAYQDQPVEFLLVNSNDPSISPEDNFERMVQQANDLAFSFPYLADPDQSLARAVGAEKNPEAFVYAPDSAGTLQLVYTGAVDDNPLIASRVEKRYLARAIDQILAGDATPRKAQLVKGCYIKRMD